MYFMLKQFYSLLSELYATHIIKTVLRPQLSCWLLKGIQQTGPQHYNYQAESHGRDGWPLKLDILLIEDKGSVQKKMVGHMQGFPYLWSSGKNFLGFPTEKLFPVDNVGTFPDLKTFSGKKTFIK
jgi:hypothetical protein